MSQLLLSLIVALKTGAFVISQPLVVAIRLLKEYGSTSIFVCVLWLNRNLSNCIKLDVDPLLEVFVYGNVCHWALD